MEKSEVRPLYRCCCCRYSGSRDSEPLFLAVYKNDLNDLKSLISSEKSVNGKSVRGNTLLNYVIEHKRLDIFNHLLTLDETEIDCVDSSGRSPLLYAIAMAADSYFALELINKGANVAQKDDRGLTALHLVAKYASSDSLTVARAIIDEGADLDALSNDGESPLYVACREGNVDYIYMLLYYGADASLASGGVLPLVMVSPSLLSEQKTQVEEILFNYTFTGNERSMRLPTLVKAMACDGRLFSKLVDPTPDVVYDESDLEYLFNHLSQLKARNFKIFMKKFGHVIGDLIQNFPLLSMLTGLSLELEISELKEILHVFLEGDYVYEFVQTSDPLSSTVAHLVHVFNKEEEEITKLVCTMLSFGLNVTSNDLDVVYAHYGRCELFKILLHMEIKMVDDRNVMAAIYYDVGINLDQHSFDVNLLRYFNQLKLKERCLNEVDEEVIAKMQFLPTVPFLTELSRDQIRKYMISKYNIKNSSQFYTVLKWLPVEEVYKRIIAYDKKLYWI